MRAKSVNEDIGTRKTPGKAYAQEFEPHEYIEKPKREQHPFKEVKGIENKYYRNFEIYQEAVERHPFVETIVEKIFHVVPNYLHQIQEDKKGVTV